MKKGILFMKILIAEDDLTSRFFLKKYLSQYGECDLAVNGLEAIELFMTSIDEKNYYDLVCIDIMMPKIDGIKALKTIRDIEKSNNLSKKEQSKVIMTTALNDKKTIMESYDAGCEAYAWKPLDIGKFEEVMKKLGLI